MKTSPYQKVHFVILDKSFCPTHSSAILNPFFNWNIEHIKARAEAIFKNLSSASILQVSPPAKVKLANKNRSEHNFSLSDNQIRHFIVSLEAWTVFCVLSWWCMLPWFLILLSINQVNSKNEITSLAAPASH